MTTIVPVIAGKQIKRSTGCRPVRVLHVILNLNTGGLERLLIEMLKCTDRAVISPGVLCIGEPGDLANEVLALGIPLQALNLPPGRHLRLPWLLTKRFRQWSADVIHTHGPYAHLYGTLGARLLNGCPVIHTKHGYLWPWTRRRHVQNRLAAMLSLHIVAVSKDLADYLHTAEKIPDRKLRVIYNGIDVAKFERPRDANMEKRPIAVMVSRLSAEKDFETVFRAASIVSRQLPDFQLRLIGDGPLRAQLETLSQDIAGQKTVRFLGNRTDVPDQLAEARLFVLSSNTEGVSIALLEAMASRLPAIATAVGGNPEVVVDGETGFLVPPRSPELMAEKILRLLARPDEAVSMGAAGRYRVEEHFNICKTVNAYQQLYFQMGGRYRSVDGAKMAY